MMVRYEYLLVFDNSVTPNKSGYSYILHKINYCFFYSKAQIRIIQKVFCIVIDSIRLWNLLNTASIKGNLILSLSINSFRKNIRLAVVLEIACPVSQYCVFGTHLLNVTNRRPNCIGYKRKN